MIENKKEERWELRALRATHNAKTGEQTMLGCLLRAILGKQRSGFPRFGNNCIITEEGFVVSEFTNRFGEFSVSTVCKVQDLEKEFRELADYLKLNDDDRKALFAKIGQWIKRDYRAKSNLEEANKLSL